MVSAGLDWVDGIYDALAPLGTGQAYQNFMDPALRGWETAYYGANLDRLIPVKRAYDPDRVFRFPQAIPDKSPGGRAECPAPRRPGRGPLRRRAPGRPARSAAARPRTGPLTGCAGSSAFSMSVRATGS